MSVSLGHHRYHQRNENRRGPPFSSIGNEALENHHIVDIDGEYVLNSSMNNGQHFRTLPYNSSSTPASLTAPHLRHHHHSRNHGINGSTSPFHRLLPSEMLSYRNATSSSSESSGNSSGMFRSYSGELKQGNERFGESETFSEKRLNRFVSSSSSKVTNSSSVWTSMEKDRAGLNATNMAIPPPQSPHHYSPHVSPNYDYGTKNLHNSPSFSQNMANATTSALEQFASKSGDGEGFNGDSGANKSIYKNLSSLAQTNTTSIFSTLQNSLINFSSAEETTMMMGGFQSDDTNGTTDSYYLDNSTAVNVSLIGNVSENGVGMDSVKRQLYAIIVPVMSLFCVLAVIVNLMIVISARWCRKPMSPTLYFSISLALADAYAAFILATGLIIHSYMPTVLLIEQSACISLIIEAFRQGGILVIVCHLLSLAMNHWIGIVRPLHYAATMTRRTAWTIIIFSWICPITVIFIYYSSVAGEGFQSEGCTKYDFLQERAYRAFFASCFFAPLILMSFIYIHIFIIVRNHHTHRQRYQSTQQLKRNVKAVLTTMLVLGTYIIGWMPATVFSLIACNDCMYHQTSFPVKTRYAITISINLLVILKTLVDPVIYAARMSDIQMALKKMRYEILMKFCRSCAPEEPPNDRGYYLNSPSVRTSFYDTRSMRMSSFGSRSSSRRVNAGNTSNNASSLLLQTNGSQMHHHHHNHNTSNQQSHKHNGAGGSNGRLPRTVSEERSHSNGAPSTNGNNRRSCGQRSQPQLLINSKSVFEMAEIN